MFSRREQKAPEDRNSPRRRIRFCLTATMAHARPSCGAGAQRKPPKMPIVIRGRGTSSRVITWVCAAFIAGLLLLAAINVRRTGGATLVAALVPAFFGAMLLYIATLRVELNGGEISFR